MDEFDFSFTFAGFESKLHDGTDTTIETILWCLGQIFEYGYQPEKLGDLITAVYEDDEHDLDLALIEDKTDELMKYLKSYVSSLVAEDYTFDTITRIDVDNYTVTIKVLD